MNKQAVLKFGAAHKKGQRHLELCFAAVVLSMIWRMCQYSYTCFHSGWKTQPGAIPYQPP